MIHYQKQTKTYLSTRYNFSFESKANEGYGWNGKWNDLDPNMKYQVADAYLKETSGNFFDLSEEEKNEYAMGYVREYNADMEYANAEKGEYNFKPDGSYGKESKATEKAGYRKRSTGYGTYFYEEKSKINCQNCGKEIYETDGDTFHTTKCRYCGHVNSTSDLTYESKANEVNYDYNKIEGGSTIEYYGYDGRTGELDGSVKKGKAWLKGPVGWVVGGGNGTIVDERSFVSSESKATEQQFVKSSQVFRK